MIDVKRPIQTTFKGYYNVPMDEFTEMTRDGVTAVYLYSPNVLSCAKLSRFDENDKSVRLMKKNGVTVAPVSLFTDYLGVKAELAGSLITLTLGQRSFACEWVTVGGTHYAPLEECSSALGLSFGTYADGRLTVFAPEELLTNLRNDEMLMRAACYAVFGKYSTEHLTHEDFVFTKDKWRKVLVGSPELNDLSDPIVLGKIAEIDEACKSKLAIMNRDPSSVILFGTEPPVASSDLLVQYGALWDLARAFGTYGSRYYRNEELKNDILYGYRWMYDNMYGESIIEGRGWRDPHLFNWWEWMTGAIEPMTDGLMVMEEFLDKETLAKYFRCYDYVSTFHRVPYREDYAATRLKVGTKVALLLEDRERLFYRFLDYDLRFEPLGPEKGKYCDHVCWTHTYPYNMGYGLGHMHRTVYVASILIGTPVEYTTPNFYDLFLTAKYMYDAALYRGRGFSVFRGRSFGAEKWAGAKAINGLISLIGAFGDEEDTYIKHMIRVSCTDEVFKKVLISMCSLYDLALLKSVLADESVSEENDKEMGYSWFTADRFAQHRNDYAFMLAMPSERHMSYESINSAHKRGWYTGDGALYLYTNADSESFEFPAFLSNDNICHRIPGVTADLRARTVWSYRKGWRPDRAYSGSMDFDEKYGMGAFDYEAYHYEGHEADGTVDDGYGGGYTYYENDLVAKKSYFFFDKECVCLGAGISSTMNSPVRTTVEHRRLVEGGKNISLMGEKMPDENFEKRFEGAAFVNLEGVGGFVFPEGENVLLRSYKYDPREGAVTDEYTANLNLKVQQFFELGIEHGENPKGATYAYFILPLADENSTRVYASCPETEIISNTAELQAVRKKSLGITAAALFKAGEIGPVCASVPCLIMYKETDEGLEVSVCDPTQKLESGEFTVSGAFECTDADIELKVECDGTAARVSADFRELAGKALRFSLKKV
ncbi:MAG: hypothetical protein IKB38_09900 [Clostridia bacterium]|nr:hypothetical protein [Clostridia bacterium]